MIDVHGLPDRKGTGRYQHRPGLIQNETEKGPVGHCWHYFSRARANWNFRASAANNTVPVTDRLVLVPRF